MRHASLFSGIGGFDLAAEWMNWQNIFSCEYMPFPQSILKHYFSSSHHYGDIRQLDGTKYRGKIDVLTGGFPCQPFSNAGKKRGTEDNRFLWPEMLRVIREIQPTWIVAENVRGIVTIEGGLVFERVCSELEANGYEVQAFCIPACSIGTYHERNRIWFIANSTSKRTMRKSASVQQENGGQDGQLFREPFVTDQVRASTISSGFRPARRGDTKWDSGWLQAATRLCRVDDGLPRELDGITVPRWRRESLKAYGNAIVPQIAYQIFQAIELASQ